MGEGGNNSIDMLGMVEVGDIVYQCPCDFALTPVAINEFDSVALTLCESVELSAIEPTLIIAMSHVGPRLNRKHRKHGIANSDCGTRWHQRLTLGINKQNLIAAEFHNEAVHINAK